MATTFDVYQTVTDKIVAALEAGTRPWVKSWKGDNMGFGLPLRSNGIPYKGVNVLLLWATGRHLRHWFTYKQAAELGAQVRKGEKGSMVIYANSGTKQVRDKVTGELKDERFFTYRVYTVFNAEQIDGLADIYYGGAPLAEVTTGKVPAADDFITNTRATINHGGDRAFYSPQTDTITLPRFGDFNTPSDYYATAAHELIHWTGAKARLDRLVKTHFGTADYAGEELVAELGAAFTMAQLGLSAEPREDHASYIASWLKALKGDKKFIFTAARAAQAAMDYLNSLQPADMAGEGDDLPMAA